MPRGRNNRKNIIAQYLIYSELLISLFLTEIIKICSREISSHGSGVGTSHLSAAHVFAGFVTISSNLNFPQDKINT
jgi:hypothetical protein